MNLELLTSFFMWCTIINGGFLILIAILSIALSDFIHKAHSKWFAMPKETFNLVFYAFVGVFKICYIIFNLVPYIALLILA